MLDIILLRKKSINLKQRFMHLSTYTPLLCILNCWSSVAANTLKCASRWWIYDEKNLLRLKQKPCVYSCFNRQILLNRM